MNNDCILCIFTMLGPKDIVICSLVCKRFNTIAKNNLLWKQLFNEKFYNICISEHDFYDNYKKYNTLNNFLIKNSKMNVNINSCFLSICYKNIQSIPQELGLLTKLQELWLIYNRLQSIPIEIGKLKMLRILHLFGNKLQTIPKEIGQLKMLQILSLHHNCLQSIPKELGQLPVLYTLFLSNNKLKTIPKELGQLTMLGSLELHCNQLQSIPKELGQLPKLRHFRLDTNLKNLINMDNGLKITYM